MTAPQWVMDEMTRRQKAARAAYRALPSWAQQMTLEEDYITQYLAQFTPITWATNSTIIEPPNYRTVGDPQDHDL